VVYGTGVLGLAATRLMLDKGVEIVGAFNRAGPKCGRDLGELAGLDRPLGVMVRTPDPVALRAAGADVAMVAVYDDMPRMAPIYRQCLEAGLNVVTAGSEASYAWNAYPAESRELDALARRMGVTLTGSANQDIFMIAAGALLSGACHEVRAIAFSSLVDVDDFGAAVAELVHVGRTPGEFAEARRGIAGDERSVYVYFLENLAAELGLSVTGYRQSLAGVPAREPVQCRALDRTVAAGCLLGTRQVIAVETEEGITLRGRTDLRVLRPGERERKEWKIDGVPALTMRFGGLAGDLTTPIQMVNRIPDVINAPPGYVTVDRLPRLFYRSRPLHHYVVSR